MVRLNRRPCSEALSKRRRHVRHFVSSGRHIERGEWYVADGHLVTVTDGDPIMGCSSGELKGTAVPLSSTEDRQEHERRIFTGTEASSGGATPVGCSMRTNLALRCVTPAVL